MTIRLRERRVRTQLTIRADFGQDEPATVVCFLRDLSLNGACLSFPDGTAVPVRFALFLDQGGGGYLVEAIWKEANTVGVRFLEPLPAGAQPRLENHYGLKFKDSTPLPPTDRSNPARSAST
jgi:hypothetical protein